MRTQYAKKCPGCRLLPGSTKCDTCRAEKKRKQETLCVDCLEAPRAGGVRCIKCRDKHRLRQRNGEPVTAIGIFSQVRRKFKELYGNIGPQRREKNFGTIHVTPPRKITRNGDPPPRMSTPPRAEYPNLPKTMPPGPREGTNGGGRPASSPATFEKRASIGVVLL